MNKSITKILIILIACFLLNGLFTAKVRAACTGVPASGNYTVSASCAFANTVDGVDAGSGTTNTAVLTVSSGQTLTVNSGQTIGYGSITVNGTILLNVNKKAILYRGPLYMSDGDADGYPVDTTTEATMSSQLTNPRRRNLMSALAVDCNDGNINIYQNVANIVTDADNDGFYASSPAAGTVCVGTTSTINTRTYYKSSAGAFSQMLTSSALTGTPQTPTTVTKVLTAAQQTWVVPTGVTAAQFDVYGARGSNSSTAGGNGGRAYGNFTVSAGQTYYVFVGGMNGYNGGGTVSTSVVRGGGASDVRTSAALANRIIVAGGGGAAAGNIAGGACAQGVTAGGAGGNLAGNGGNATCTGGKGATISAGGAAGVGNSSGTAGSSGNGGNAGGQTNCSGGPGGGGYFGGGGGGAMTSTNSGCGGGGGSNYIAANSTGGTSSLTGINTGNGQVIINYNLPGTPTSVDCNDSNASLYPGNGC